MFGLQETAGPSVDGRSQLKLGAGAGLVLAGAVAVAAGLANVLVGVLPAAGVPATSATRYSVLVAGAIPPLALAVVGARVAGRRGQWLRRGGVAGAGAALLAVWAGSPAGVAATGVAAAPAALYLGGLLGVYLGTVAGGLETAAGSHAGRSRASFYREERGHPGDHVAPADGGEDRDADLSFPLDDEE